MPAILSDPLIAVVVNLATDENAAPSITRVPDDASADDRAEYMTWYPFVQASSFSVYEPRRDGLFPHRLSSIKRLVTSEQSRQAGKDARHLWFAQRDWRGEDPEGSFGALGAWAERRMKELGVDGAMSLVWADKRDEGAWR